jgi:hypothetical protein
MRATPCSLVLVLALKVAGSCMAADEPSQCRAVKGELQIWNGWPPSYRIRTTSGEVYGLEGGDSTEAQLPESLKVALTSRDGPVRGTFTVCPTGANTSVSYDKKPIHLARLIAFVPRVSK